MFLRISTDDLLTKQKVNDNFVALTNDLCWMMLKDKYLLISPYLAQEKDI
jgi:hypothetical protein